VLHWGMTILVGDARTDGGVCTKGIPLQATENSFDTNSALQAAEKVALDEGHGFSRAAFRPKLMRALAPEVPFFRISAEPCRKSVPQGLKAI